jgi:hypothetical protein
MCMCVRVLSCVRECGCIYNELQSIVWGGLFSIYNIGLLLYFFRCLFMYFDYNYFKFLEFIYGSLVIWVESIEFSINMESRNDNLWQVTSHIEHTETMQLVPCGYFYSWLRFFNFLFHMSLINLEIYVILLIQ